MARLLARGPSDGLPFLVAMVLIAIDVAWVALAARARRLLRSPRALRVANWCSAGMMAGAATAIAAR